MQTFFPDGYKQAGAQTLRPDAVQLSRGNQSAEKKVVIAGAIGKNRGVNHFTTGTTLPGIESTDEIIILVGIHTAFALGAFHDATSFSISELPAPATKRYMPSFHKPCQPA